MGFDPGAATLAREHLRNKSQKEAHGCDVKDNRDRRRYRHPGPQPAVTDPGAMPGNESPAQCNGRQQQGDGQNDPIEERRSCAACPGLLGHACSQIHFAGPGLISFMIPILPILAADAKDIRHDS